MTDPTPRPHGLSTRAVHAGDPPSEVFGPVVNPIFQTTTFYNAPEGGAEVLYTRFGNNPNQVRLEARIAALEGTEACLATGSGMAAMAAALLGHLQAGDHVVAAEGLYGGTRLLLTRELSRLGISTTYVDLHAPEWEKEIQPNTRVLLAEFPTNPLLRVADPKRMVAVARERGLVTVLDATFATPINFRGVEHGIDLVVHSATKYLSGHSDVTAGAVCGSEAHVEPARQRAQLFGPLLDPHAAWLLERGIKTLALRMDRHNANGLAVSRWCQRHAAIERVHYPGLRSHPDHPIALRVLQGFGGMMSLELRGGGDAATRLVRSLRLIKVASSLGSVESLVSEPRHTSHTSLTREAREALGIRDGLLRFSLGIEDPEDLIADLEQALASLED